VVADHTSILRFIEARFHLPSLTKRDANADPLYDLFDFSRPALLTPPPLPTPPVDAQKLSACQSQFPLM
jgi:phospholipase C